MWLVALTLLPLQCILSVSKYAFYTMLTGEALFTILELLHSLVLLLLKCSLAMFLDNCERNLKSFSVL